MGRKPSDEGSSGTIGAIAVVSWERDSVIAEIAAWKRQLNDRRLRMACRRADRCAPSEYRLAGGRSKGSGCCQGVPSRCLRELRDASTTSTASPKELNAMNARRKPELEQERWQERRSRRTITEPDDATPRNAGEQNTHM